MIIKRDKEFSLVGDIYHSGAKRAYKKYVGRTRRTLAKKINKSASKNAIKLLKEKGASKDEISKAKDNLKHGLNSYKYTGRAALKSNIAQTVEIPSRRVKRK